MHAHMATDCTDEMPPPKEHHRKMLSVPQDLADAIKEFRFEHRLESEAEAYRLLLREGLESFRRRKAEAEEHGVLKAQPRGRKR